MRPTTAWRFVWRRGLRVIVLFAASALASGAWAVDLIGYLPYYRMNASYNANVLPRQLAMLDEIRYFGLTAGSNGSIVPLSDSGSVTTNLGRIATIRQAIEAMPEAERPRLNITLGGAGEAANFAAVAASATLRATLAQNIDALLDQTGATSVDIDWEHPSAGIERTTHYPALLARIKEEIGPDRRVYATVAPSVVINNSVFTGPNAVDGVSLMTYDLGWWGNDPGNPFAGEHSLPEYVVDAVNAWTEPPGSQNDRPWVFGTWGNNAPAEMLGVGMPFYGRNIHGSTAYTYAELVGSGTTTDGNYYSYNGQTVWVLDPELAAARAEFAHDRGLKNIIIWELAQDLPPSHPDSLLRAAFEKLQSLQPIPGDYDGDGEIGLSDYELWGSTFGFTSGDLRADGNGDGIVDAADYTFWRDRVTPTSGSAAIAQAVPEPTAAAMVVVIVGMGVCARRIRRREPRA